ncbi:MAG: hypothetical protein ACWGO1_03835 [Anaerolineales bacterium]
MPATRLFIGMIVLMVLVSCSSPPSPTQEPTTPATSLPGSPTPVLEQVIESDQGTPSPTALLQSTPTRALEDQPSSTPQPSPTSTPTFSPESWKDLPVIPDISDRVKEIYQAGVELGNNPRAFSKIGDCGSTPAWFLGDFDRGPRFYNLGDHQYLEAVIQEFQGSYGRTSLAAKSGFNASSVFATLWANREYCLPDETPLACEYRVQRPILAFIMLGSNDVWHLDTFEPQMKNIIEFSIQNGVIPVLSTKADNLEKDHAINQTIARLAMEYQIPVVNYWRAVQDLPDKGLQEDAVHITWGPNRFDDPQVMKAGWPVRNLVTLETLDQIWQAVSPLDAAQQ